MKRKEAKLNNLYVFGSKGYSKREREHLRKINAQRNELIFLGYSLNNRAFRVFNKCPGIVIESVNVRVGDLEHTKMDSKNSALINILEK